MADKSVRVLAAAGLLIAGGCARELEGEDPPASSFYFPVGITASPRCAEPAQPCHVFVVNSNFDLRFNAGWLSSIDVDALLEGRPAVASQLLTPSLGGQVGVDDGGSVGLVTARGGNALARVEIGEDGSLSCGDKNAESGLSAAEQRTDCDSAHLIEILDEDVQEVLSERIRERADIEQRHVDDAFGVALFRQPAGDPLEPCESGCAAVGFLGSGIISILDYSQTGRAAHVRAINLGNTLVNDVVLRPSAVPGQVLLAATSAALSGQRSASAIYDVDVAVSISSEEDGVVERSIFSEVGGTEVNDLVFSPDGERAYAVNRNPDQVVVLDTRLVRAQVQLASGAYDPDVLRPLYNVIGAETIKGRPSGIAQITGRPSGQDLLAVASFDDDALFILSVTGDSLRLERRFDGIADGPWDVVHVRRGERELLLISAFNSHGVALVDVSASDPAQFQQLPVLHNPEVVR